MLTLLFVAFCRCACVVVGRWCRFCLLLPGIVAACCRWVLLLVDCYYCLLFAVVLVCYLSFYPRSWFDVCCLLVLDTVVVSFVGS